MKKIAVYVLTALAVLALALTVFPASVKADSPKFTEFTCTETYVATLDPGSWTFPDSNIHVRGLVQLLREGAPDPRSVGDNIVVVNANWHSDLTGPMWGTFRLETDEGGVWEGTWAGQRTGQGSWYNAVGDGIGLYAGMKMWVNMNFGDCQIRVLEH